MSAPSPITSPATAEQRPLLVLLHGDGQDPVLLLNAFKAEAKARDVSLVAPMCPMLLGCNAQSFWRWNGDPAWLKGIALEAARAAHADTNRIAYVGWSGGASYLGYRVHELGDTPSAIVILGGGIPPARSTCAKVQVPVLFVVGNKNPYHHLAQDLRASLNACAEDAAAATVQWQLLPGADHAEEWRQVSSAKTQASIVEFVLAHSRQRGESPTPLQSASTLPSTPPVVATSPAVRGVRHGCCLDPSIKPGDVDALLLGVLFIALLRFNRQMRPFG
jgi:predicted esterase